MTRDEMHDIVKARWDAGESMKEIARQLGAGGYSMSRNAVAGVIYRNDWTKKQRPAAAKHKPAKKMKPNWNRPPASAPKAAPTPPTDAVSFGHRPVSILDLTDRSCRWPEDQKDEHGLMMYCGDNAVVGFPYCAGHVRISLDRPPQKRPHLREADGAS